MTELLFCTCVFFFSFLTLCANTRFRVYYCALSISLHACACFCNIIVKYQYVFVFLSHVVGCFIFKRMRLKLPRECGHSLLLGGLLWSFRGQETIMRGNKWRWRGNEWFLQAISCSRHYHFSFHCLLLLSPRLDPTSRPHASSLDHLHSYRGRKCAGER